MSINGARDMLSIDIRRKRFGGEGRPDVLRDISIAVDDGQFVCILGPSGCGKTTLLNIVAGLDPEFDGAVKAARGPESNAARIGYVFQNPVLLPWRTVRENLALVMAPDQIQRGLIDSFLAAVGLDGIADAHPRSLSLGMARRAALARAFVVEPDLLLLDEPFVSVDESTAQSLRELLIRLWHEKPVTVLFVTHDSREAVQLAQRIIVLSDRPASVVRDLTLDLTNEQRTDPVEVDAFRKRLLNNAAKRTS
jgi:ABC-type nitrate/sulfonate/bicarbonate transport system ATPase subunit